MVEKKSKHSRLFYQYLLSYIFILLIPLVILAIFIYGYALDTLKEEIYNNNMSTLQIAQETIETSLQNTTSLEYKMYLSETLDSFRLKTDTIKAIYAQNELNKYRRMNPYLRDLVYYQEGDAYIVSASSSCMVREFWNHMYIFEDWSYDSFLAELKNSDGDFYFKEVQTVGLNNGRTEYNVVLLVLPLVKGSQSRCVILMLDESFFVDLMPQIELQQEVSAIVKNDGSIIAGKGNFELIEELHTTQPEMDSAMDEVVIQGRKYLRTRIYSEKYQWSYESLVLTSNIQEKMVLILWLTVLACFLACAGGAIGIAYFMKRNYMPLQELEDTSNKILENVGCQNEIDHVKTVLEYLERQNNKFQEEEEQRGLALRDRFLSKWIAGRCEDSRLLAEQAAEVGICLKKTIYQAAVIHTTRFLAMQEQMIEDVLQNAVPSGVDAYLKVQSETERILMVIGFDQESSNIVDAFYSDTISLIENDMELDCYMGLGGIRSGAEHIRDSYMEALNALEYRMILFEQKIIRYEEIMLREPISNIVNPKELGIYVKNRDIGGLEKFLDNARDELVQKRAPIRQVRMQSKDFLYALEKIIDEVNRDCFIDNPICYDIINVLHYDNFKELMEIIYLIGCDIINHLNMIEGRNTIEDLIGYVTDNCYKGDFSTAMMAEEFKMSLPYLSQYFKKHMNRTLSDYVAELRINRAKELLRESDLSIKEVAENVGYFSVNSFIRRFKQMEGYTPGDWRNGTVR